MIALREVGTEANEEGDHVRMEVDKEQGLAAVDVKEVEMVTDVGVDVENEKM